MRRLALVGGARAPLVHGYLRLDALDVHAATVPRGLRAISALGLEAHDCFAVAFE